MASHRLNPLYAIKECMTCGSLYTRECCSIGSLGNKILVPEPESSPCCAKCGTPVDGPYCRGCALLRKNFKEDLLTYCGENETSKDFEDISESSDDNTNVINALQEPIVVNQDPGKKSSQGPPLINQNCCYECGDSLDGIFCQQCICKFCGKGAHYGYNCPPKVLIISNPEQYDQTINEFPHILPNVHPTCNYEDENSFIYDSKPHSFNVSPSVFCNIPYFQVASKRFDVAFYYAIGLSVLKHPIVTFPLRPDFGGVTDVPLDEIEIDENLCFVEEPLEIVERDVKKLKRRRIPLVKVRWNSRQGVEYTWE
ncbi:hypothetical protein Tco_0731596 [Tanacetum coccineum]